MNRNRTLSPNLVTAARQIWNGSYNRLGVTKWADWSAARYLSPVPRYVWTPIQGGFEVYVESNVRGAFIGRLHVRRI